MSAEGRRPRRGLDPDERALWERVKRHVRPLRPEQGPPPASKRADTASISDEAAAPHTGAEAKGAARPAGVPAGKQKPKPPPAPAPPGDLDQKTRRKLARGTVALDARLDLHGLSQADAHRRLRAFLIRAHGDGLKHVLVITGTGRRRTAPGELGVLRRAVPVWLAAPDLRPFVASTGPAHPSHGGDGALYVRLASRRRTRPPSA